MSDLDLHFYYVEASDVTPDEPHPGFYWSRGGRPRGPFSSRREAEQSAGVDRDLYGDDIFPNTDY